ncbi:MAG: c-type cytochrome [Cupriavidus necator]
MKSWVFSSTLSLAATFAFGQAQLPGEKLVKAQCIQCHTIARGEPHGAGPNLYGVMGRPAGGAEGFKFSDGYMAAMKGKTWDPRLLDRWLADTQAMAPGNGMTYFQEDDRKRRQIIEYLATLK